MIEISGLPPVAQRQIPRTPSIIDFTDSDSDDNGPILVAETGGCGTTSNGQNSSRRDLFSRYVAQVLEVIPDVQPEYVLQLVQTHYERHNDTVLERVLQFLFENDSYPKVEKVTGKRKREDDDEGRRDKLVKIDYGSKARPKAEGPNYGTLALNQLCLDFPYIPMPHIRRQLSRHNGLYAPTHLFLRTEMKSGILPYKLKVRPSRIPGKGVERRDELFLEEREWLLLELQEEAAMDDAKLAEQLNEKEYEELGQGIECGCCFTTYPFDKMVQCPDAHLFCVDCMTSYASNMLGSHNYNIVCMDQSGCKSLFTHSELRRFLTPKLLSLYERVKQTAEIRLAGLDNLEECPHCDFKVVIENPDERLFRCQNKECEAVTCRKCKKSDHLPKTCEEMDKDRTLDGRHIIEEAMTKALMRNCPRCQKAFVKEMGCNKMTCPGCKTLSCYVCRSVINGYDHFKNGKPGFKGCIVWDPFEKTHTREIAAAAKKALEDFKRDHPDVDEKDLEVDVPKTPAEILPNQAQIAYPHPQWMQGNLRHPLRL